MKIDDHSAVSSSLRNVARSATTNYANAQSASKTGGGTLSGPSDGIQLTSLGRMSGQVMEAAENARAARVQQLRELYVKGQHQAGANEISGAVIDAHLAGL